MKAFMKAAYHLAFAAVVIFAALFMASANADAAEPAKIEAAAVLKELNEEREAAGLPAVAMSGKLTLAAMTRAAEASQLFSHVRPDGTDYYTVDAANVQGENLAKGFDDADGLVQGWMDSPSHRANILYGATTRVGIAAYAAPDGTIYVALELN